MKKKFDEVGIEIPFPHTSIYFGEASKPFQLQTQVRDAEQLKEMARTREREDYRDSR
jgi:moderate conductance mechanosensitive channel